MTVTTSYAHSSFEDLLHAQWAFFFDLLDIGWTRATERPPWLPAGVPDPVFDLRSRNIWFTPERSTGNYDIDARFGEVGDQNDDDDDPWSDLADLREPAGNPRGLYLLWFGDIPNPATMAETGPPNENTSIALFADGGRDNAHFWTRCPRCGYVDATYNGRAGRVRCQCPKDSDKEYRANDPAIVGAYRTSRATIAARRSGAKCGPCCNRVTVGDLIVNFGGTWLHAKCGVRLFESMPVLRP